MIYCNRIDAHDDHAMYAYGPSPNDLTGRMTVYADDRHYSIDRKHDGLGENWVCRVCIKYKESLRKKEFPERMAVEI